MLRTIVLIDASTHYLYVSTRTNVVSVIDRQSNRIVASVPVGDQSIGIVVVPKFNRNPAIRAEKTVNGLESVTAMPGDTVFFQLRVTNIGNTLLSQIQVLDALDPPGAALLNETIESLAPGASITRELSYVIPSPPPASILENRLTASAPLSGVSADAAAGDAASGTLFNQAVVTFGVRSPSGRAITTRAVSNRAQVTITEEEE
ncbi:DUF7507 domain-containing protein [Paenibacillus pasadenensis]|uniref:DUF7507 domain-containing protein n=1 Tax=Paenibacillus pasadenensis TaxID=217090 RepID=UPI003F7E1754